MQAILIDIAYAAFFLLPLVFLVRFLRNPPLPQPIPTITALLFLRWSMAPVVLYAALFMLLAIIEELSGFTLISADFQHSLLLAIAIAIPWTLLLTMLVLGIATHRFRRQM